MDTNARYAYGRLQEIVRQFLADEIDRDYLAERHAAIEAELKATEQALDTATRQIFANHGAAPSWEDYPEIGEHDWNAVRERCVSLALEIAPPSNEWRVAYEHLATRAQG